LIYFLIQTHSFTVAGTILFDWAWHSLCG